MEGRGLSSKAAEAVRRLELNLHVTCVTDSEGVESSRRNSRTHGLSHARTGVASVARVRGLSSAAPAARAVCSSLDPGASPAACARACRGLSAQCVDRCNRCDDQCEKHRFETQVPCGDVRRCRDDTVTHDTSVQVKMSHPQLLASLSHGHQKHVAAKQRRVEV